ncbi:glycosyltransferase family 4 protein [Haliea sp.]|uniref:glycosyltransferase family 4 protein n=1 Tax=Haliea sp. TaxID=1932666 RepID=UPI0025C4D161|nr:glycosyltransferase family 4 protein [Haliea sp.]
MSQLHLGLVGPVPPPNGGMAMQTEQLARLLRAEGLQVSQVATNAPYRPAWVGRVPGLRALSRFIPYLWAVWRLAGKVDLIHLMANSGWSWQLFSAPVLWLAPLRRCPVIVNYRGGEAQVYFARSWNRVKPSLNRAALIVVPSGYLSAVFNSYGQPTRIIPNIVDQSVFKPAHDTSVSARPFTLVITRNLEPIYGIETALRALAEVLQTAPATRMRIAGSGPQESELRGLASTLGVDGAVEFTGRLDRPGIARLYAEADAMLNPTTVDNMPNSVIEALACGVPVISTEVGGVPYIVQDEHTALLVPADDPAAMASAILRLQNDVAMRNHLSAQGLVQVAQYAWPAVRERWLAAYYEVAGREPEAVV